MKNNLKIIIIGAFTTFTILGAILINNLFKKNSVNYNYVNPTTRTKITSATTATNTSFTVTIDGEVIYKGKYEFSEPISIKEIIKISGGLTPLADDSLINSNAIVSSDSFIFIAPKNGNSYLLKDGEALPRININTADSALLEKLDGIGPVKAKKIIEYRAINGFYKSIEELHLNGIISKDLFEKIKDQITV